MHEVFAADYVVHASDKDFKGLDFVRRFIGELRLAVPDLRVVEVAFLLQAGDTIVWQRTLSGTHEAEMMGIPPSKKKVNWNDIVVTRFVGEKIAEEWSVSDLAGKLLLKLPNARELASGRPPTVSFFLVFGIHRIQESVELNGYTL